MPDDPAPACWGGGCKQPREAERNEADRSAAAGKTIAPEAAAQPGAIGAFQRREDRYSSHLLTWRRERQTGILKGLTPHQRGPVLCPDGPALSNLHE